MISNVIVGFRLDKSVGHQMGLDVETIKFLIGEPNI